MLTKHFFKTLVVFTMLIALGLIGIFAVNYIEKTKNPPDVTNSIGVAK